MDFFWTVFGLYSDCSWTVFGLLTVSNMLYKVKAIVLGGRDIGEADKIITLYSEERGKIKAVAKGIRKTKSKFGSSLELFTLSRLLIYSKNDYMKQVRLAGSSRHNSLDIISDAQIQDSFKNLRKDLAGFAYGNFLVELVDRLTGEGEPGGQRMFHLLKEFLGLCKELSSTRVLIYGFTFRLFNTLGYYPRIDKCVVCSTAVKSGRDSNFSVSQGGILCNSCKKVDGSVSPLSTPSLQYFKQLMRMEPRRLSRLKILPYCEREMENIVQDYLDFYLEKNMVSFSFLKKMGVECRI